MDDLTDPSAFARAYAEHRPAALGAALAVLHDARAAEDVVQDVFASLWANPRAFDGQRGTLRSYVTLLARSRALDRWRSRRARDGALERMATVAARRGHAPPAADAVLEREGARHALSLIDRLPRPQREAIVLAVGHDLTAAQVSRATGIPLGTAKSRIRLGLAKVRALAQAA
jgi:RNA polymerase sigma-70 factor (ECF subfamily)